MRDTSNISANAKRIVRGGYRTSRELVRRILTHGQNAHDIRRTALFSWRFVSTRVQRERQRRSVLKDRSGVDSIRNSVNSETDRTTIALLVSGGIGDYLVVARFLRDLAAEIEPARFDIFCSNPAVGDWVFAAVPGFNKCHSEFLFTVQSVVGHYDLALRASQFVTADDDCIDWAGLQKSKRLQQVVTNLTRARRPLETFIEHHPHLDASFARRVVFDNLTRETFLHYMAGITYGGPRFDLKTDDAIVDQLGLRDRPFVTINNGFDAGFIITGTASTKTYPHGDELCRLLKERFPDLTIIQIGNATSQPLANADINLISKTSLAAAAALVQHASLHIDNEGGLVHVASAFGTRCCVLFGPTPADYYAYEDNINILPNFCGGCWWSTETWMDVCPRGFKTARCLSEQLPADVVAQIAAVWKPSSKSMPLAS